MNNPHPKKIFIEKDVANSSVTLEVLNKLPNVQIEYIDDYRTIHIKGETTDNIYKESKECLAIARKRGDLVKEFRCRDGIVGSTEYYITHGNNCSYDCEYCFLQSYFDNAVPTVFVNHDDILNAIRDVIVKAGEKRLIFHAGELCDALAFDNYTNLSQKLILLFSRFSNTRLELRTKSTQIDNLLTVPCSDNIIISWTFTPQIIIDNHEHKTPSLEDRIGAAVKVQKAGYNVGICLDPIIICDDLIDNYKIMIKMIFDRLDASRIKYVSLGGLRFLPSLARIIRERNSQTRLLLGEFVSCVDGKHRYFRSIRAEIYREISRMIRERSNSVKVSLCMETEEVWNEVEMEDDKPRMMAKG